MAAKGYCDVGDVADWLGQTFTAAQTLHCENLIERAERYIDNYTGRAWMVEAQSNERHYVDSRNVYLKYAPVASVASVTGRPGLGESEETLVADDDYEVRDLNSGLIVLVFPANYDRVLVSYTPVFAAPVDIQQACTEITANWMQSHLQPGSYGIDSISLPDLTLRYARSHVQQAAPPAARAILDHYRYPVAA